jgi:hypothetical protein
MAGHSASKIIAAMPYVEPDKEGGPDFEDTEAFEKWRAEQRSWGADRARTETIARGMNEFDHEHQRDRALDNISPPRSSRPRRRGGDQA